MLAAVRWRPNDIAPGADGYELVRVVTVDKLAAMMTLASDDKSLPLQYAASIKLLSALYNVAAPLYVVGLDYWAPTPQADVGCNTEPTPNPEVGCNTEPYPRTAQGLSLLDTERDVK